MEQALNYLYLIFDGFIDLVFNDLEIAPNVSLGWIMISVILFALIIRSVLNMPRGINLHRPSTTTYYDRMGRVTGFSKRRQN